jgi:hypothetical protein
MVNYDRNCSFMVLDTVITIVNYDRHMFIVQATGSHKQEVQRFYETGFWGLYYKTIRIRNL